MKIIGKMRKKKINELRTGIKIESEHQHTVNFIRKYAKKHKGRIPPNRLVYKNIAQDHLREFPKVYYTELSKMERKLKHGKKAM
jgi:sulfur relay (sulfurtransferase) DsrC/TusE family protein